MHNLVKSYLVHYAYVETLQAYEDEEMELDQEQTLPAIGNADPAQTNKEDEIEKIAKNAIIKPLNGQANVFPGLSQNQIKQVQRKKALE